MDMMSLSREKKLTKKIQTDLLVGFIVVVYIYIFSVSFFFENKITENCNRVDDFMTVSHSAKHSLAYAFVRLSPLRGLKDF